MKQFLFLPALLLAACSPQQTASVPDAVAMTTAALGHYCQMNVREHPGPKAQVHLVGVPNPIWFVQIRDGLAYDRMPEQSADVAAIYVSDMGAEGVTWEMIGPGHWVRAEDAYYVVNSVKRGGMGAPDFIPFSTQAAARQFTLLHGGTVRAYGDITDDEILAPVEVQLEPVAELSGPSEAGEPG